jgi:hypothetical protein
MGKIYKELMINSRLESNEHQTLRRSHYYIRRIFYDILALIR